MNKHKDLLLEVAEQMETLSLFADQAAWDSIVSRVKAAANVDCTKCCRTFDTKEALQTHIVAAHKYTRMKY